MTFVPILEGTLGQCVPLALTASLELEAAIGLMLPELNAKIAGLLQLQASLTLTPPTLALSLQLALDLVAALEASIAIGLPSLDFQLSAVAALLIELDLFLGALNAKLSLALQFQAILGSPGFFAYQYTGAIGNLGTEAQAALGGGIGGGPPSLPVGAWVFVATDAGAIEAGKAVFASV